MLPDLREIAAPRGERYIGARAIRQSHHSTKCSGATLSAPAWHWRNELLWWYALCALFAAACFLASGWSGVAFFVAQAFVGIALLEVVNYVEHYGLARKQLADGRYEPVRV